MPPHPPHQQLHTTTWLCQIACHCCMLCLAFATLPTPTPLLCTLLGFGCSSTLCNSCVPCLYLPSLLPLPSSCVLTSFHQVSDSLTRAVHSTYGIFWKAHRSAPTVFGNQGAPCWGTFGSCSEVLRKIGGAMLCNPSIRCAPRLLQGTITEDAISFGSSTLRNSCTPCLDLPLFSPLDTAACFA